MDLAVPRRCVRLRRRPNQLDHVGVALGSFAFGSSRRRVTGTSLEETLRDRAVPVGHTHRPSGTELALHRPAACVIVSASGAAVRTYYVAA